MHDIRYPYSNLFRTDTPLTTVAPKPDIQSSNAASTPPLGNANPISIYAYVGGNVPVRMQAALNYFTSGVPGEAFLYFLIQRGFHLPTIPDPEAITFAQIKMTSERLGYTVGDKSLRRYFEGAETILHPISCTSLGCNPVPTRRLRTISEIQQTLIAKDWVDQQVHFFRDHAQLRIDIPTGAVYTLSAVPADILAQVLIDAGLDAVSARNAAEMLQDQHFDRSMRKQRTAASSKAEDAHEEFCRTLEDGLVVPPSLEIPIQSERTFKWALARAWHGAGVPKFSTAHEQMQALGISNKHTLRTYLEGAGVEKEAQIVGVRLVGGEDISEQVKENMQNLRAQPMTFVAIDEDGVKTRHIFNRADIDQTMERGEDVFVEYQGPNLHHLVEVPTGPAVKRPANPRTSTRQVTPRRPKCECATPGKYPKDWTWNQLNIRYKLKYRKSAPGATTVEGLVRLLIKSKKS